MQVRMHRDLYAARMTEIARRIADVATLSRAIDQPSPATAPNWFRPGFKSRATTMHSVDDEPDVDSVHAQYDRMIDALSETVTEGRRAPRRGTVGPVVVHGFSEADLETDLEQRSTID
jgi:hypothetical protein